MVRFDAVVDVDVSSFDTVAQERYRYGLVSLLELSPEDIELTMTPASTRVVSHIRTSGLAAADAIVTTLTTAPTSSLSTNLGFPITQISSITSFQRAAKLPPSPPLPANPPPLPCPLGEVAGSDNQCERCPEGTYCTDGVMRQCPVNTYSALKGQADESTCRACPLHTNSPLQSTSLSDCQCDVTFFLDEQTSECKPCPFHGNGTICPYQGMTVRDIILLPGYYRWRFDVEDIRPCPDLARCEGNGKAAGTHWQIIGLARPSFGRELNNPDLSAELANKLPPLGHRERGLNVTLELGGAASDVDVALDQFIFADGLYLRPRLGMKAVSPIETAYCNPTLGGPYCQLCLDHASNGSVYYNADETKCEECGDASASNPALQGFLIALAAFGAVFGLLGQDDGFIAELADMQREADSYVMRLMGACLMLYLTIKDHVATAKSASGQVRELLSFVQVVTNLGDIYLIRFPASFSNIVKSIAGLITITAPFPPLACLGVVGHATRLRLFSQMPLIIAAIIIFGHVAYGGGMRAWTAIKRPRSRPRRQAHVPRQSARVARASKWPLLGGIFTVMRQLGTDALTGLPW